MEKNMGTIDRLIRIIIAAVLILLIVLKVITGIWIYVAALVAVVFIVTSMLGFCPLYKLLGISTCKD
ncbi:YgaP family membrane protein [Thermospira aquatica]|uniref:DUF2892 domain-containing protein n=1 Tax=Thermospira aquatica TaxID=2828656 RepID=A0AAX3BAL3_9SPIR|nr:DUF2892 domain-containing protein [Thermospira aquatica]URA09302.1 DUF2892 domain-containing protein [Thermospira aquatica]